MTVQDLTFTPLEGIHVRAPVDRIDYVVDHCRDRHVLDLGCYDETALVKRETDAWLHGRIASVAASVLGIDSSAAIPEEGIATGPRSRIMRGDATALAKALAGQTVDVVVAGELIEHLPNALEFLKTVKTHAAGRRFIATTPNATSLTNLVLALAARESTHPDHLQVLSYKTLHTLCLRARFESWSIVPYYVRYTEMILRSAGARRTVVRAAERLVNTWEHAFPCTPGGSFSMSIVCEHSCARPVDVGSRR